MSDRSHREEAEACLESAGAVPSNCHAFAIDPTGEALYAAATVHALLAIAERLGGPCPTCGGTDPEGGTVATAGPDENGQYDTDDCPDHFGGSE